MLGMQVVVGAVKGHDSTVAETLLGAFERDQLSVGELAVIEGGSEHDGNSDVWKEIVGSVFPQTSENFHVPVTSEPRSHGAIGEVFHVGERGVDRIV